MKMKRTLYLAILILCGALPALAQHRTPVATAMDANGKMLWTDYLAKDLAKPEPPQTVITQEVVVDYLCIPNPGNPATGSVRLYCDSGTGQLTCLTSTGANCLGGGGAGSVTSVGLAAPTGIQVSGSPVTSTGTLTWAMPSGWILGDLLDGNGANSVAIVHAPTTPNSVSQMLVSTPVAGVGQQWVPALAGLPGRVVSGTTDTILATDRQPGTVEYRSNAAVAVTVPDPGSAGFGTNPSFKVANEFAGAVTFTPQTSAVITYCSGSVCFQNQPNLVLFTGQYATWSSPDNNNWLVFVTNQGAATTCNDVLLTGGGVTWTGGLNFTVSAATYCVAGTTYSSAQTNLTLTTADPTNPRIDVIAVDNTGTAIVITGTPAGSPAAPSVDPTTQLSLTFVTVPAGSSTPTISSILVYDENAGTPTEWNCTPSANFNCNSTNNPFHLTHDIEATTAVATNNVVLANSATVNLSTYSTLAFNIRNKAAWPNQKSVSICFKNSSTVVGTCIGFKNGVYGFNQANTTGYQQIVIPLSAFALGSTVVDRVVFTVVGGGGSIGFYLDWIQIQSALSGNGGGGTVSPPPPSAHLLGSNATSGFVAASQTDVNAVGYVAGGGTANAQTAALTPPVTALTNGLQVCWLPSNANASTTPTLAVNGLTAKTIVKVGGAALAASDLTTTAIACAIYDGTNFELQNPQTTTASGYSTLENAGTSITQRPTLNFIGAGSANINCVDNSGATRSDCTVTGINGPPSPTVNYISTTSYTVQNSDNSWRDVFTANTNAIAVTLPQANTIATSPFIGTRYNTSPGSCTTCATSSFAQSAGHALIMLITSNTGVNINSVTDSAGDTFQLAAPPAIQSGNNVYLYYAMNIAAAGANIVTVVFSGATTPNMIVNEYSVLTYDHGGSTTVSSGQAVVTIPVSFTNEVAIGVYASLTSNACSNAGGFVSRGSFGGNGIDFCERLLSSVASSTFALNAAGSTASLAQADWAITSSPVFTTGWYVILENGSSGGAGVVTVTPTTSTINGQTTLVIPPNEGCAVMSDGANYDAHCYTMPNRITNGVMGQIVEIAGVNTSNTSSDVSTTTLIATGATDAFYHVMGDVNCHAAVSTGVETLTVTFTDTSNTVQTYTANAACTTLGSSSIGSIVQAFRAKGGTNIQYATSHTGTQPSYDVSVGVYQLGTK